MARSPCHKMIDRGASIGLGIIFRDTRGRHTRACGACFARFATSGSESWGRAFRYKPPGIGSPARSLSDPSFPAEEAGHPDDGVAAIWGPLPKIANDWFGAFWSSA